jgi:hypothetical protein
VDKNEFRQFAGEPPIKSAAIDEELSNQMRQELRELLAQGETKEGHEEMVRYTYAE